MEYACGGLVSGPDPTPIFTETLLATWPGPVIPASVVRTAGREWMAKLNELCASSQLP
ncbi:hypothetical protein [Mycolicibacterium fortuitum]|uniref:hypothetical protein n=1 Tax=Mycolicibacterium fortuitum TaxID=1766 RepID=UPI001AF022E9|nr:hypothetical protein [Mycolicibacterium fortuitum]MBP3086940.1 hypothetical protein [Mycolicibacterium fortuitum]